MITVNCSVAVVTIATGGIPVEILQGRLTWFIQQNLAVIKILIHGKAHCQKTVFRLSFVGYDLLITGSGFFFPCREMYKVLQGAGGEGGRSLSAS